ncbi:MAG TPA: ATP-binding protein [Streptosporangiaceae bacterium]|nr:ATP-binding protein [Streptosporangiaceae bacterium]
MTSRTSTQTAPRPRGSGARPAQGETGTVDGTASPLLSRGPSQSRAPVPVLPAQHQGTDMAARWPVRDYLELGALPGAVPSARLHTCQLVWEWGLTPLSADAEQVVSELTANAVAAAQATPGTDPVRLWLLTDNQRLLVLVWDADPQPPALVQADEYAESGRGLLLVATLSDEWGSYPTPQQGGKVVWALIGAQQ